MVQYLTAVQLYVFIHATRYALVYHVLYTKYMESSIERNGEAWSRRHCAVLCLLR